MKKHFVRTFGAALLTVGSLVVVSAQPASAFKYFVHGNVHCQIRSGSVTYAPPLREAVSEETRLRIKGTLDCTGPDGQGETGLTDGTTVSGGTFKVISNPFSGTCGSGEPDEIEMVIHWTPNGPSKIRNTEVSWIWDPANDTASSEPYGLSYVGGTVTNLGISGSYTGATAAVNFSSGLGADHPEDPGVFGSSACHNLTSTGRLRTGWTLDPTLAGLSELTFQSAPFVSNVNPNSATLGTQNADLDITGQDFSPGDTVSFSGTGINVNSTTFISPNELTANVSIDPDALAGTRDVTVTNSTLGSSTCTACFMVSPIVSGVSPATAGQGATNRNITITGEGFESGAVAQFGAPGSGITVNYTQFLDANTLNANINVAPGAPLTAYDVQVIDPGFGVGTCAGCFSVNSGPTVSSASPSVGVGATNHAIAINGGGFVNGSTVSIGGTGVTVSNTSYVSPTQLTATISIAPGTVNGAKSVTVVNPDGGQGSCAACFTVNKAPVITDWQVIQSTLKKSVLRVDSKGRTNREVWTTDVNIIGSGFIGNGFFSQTLLSYASDDVTVNTTTFLSPTKIKQNVTIDIQDYLNNALPADRAITATNPDGGTYTLQGAVVLLV